MKQKQISEGSVTLTFSLECSKLVRNYALSCDDMDGQCKNSEL